MRRKRHWEVDMIGFARRRHDHHHELCARIAGEAALFATQTLAIKNMTGSRPQARLRNRVRNVAQKSGLNREICDTAPARLLSLIAYKVQETGGHYLQAPTRTLKPSQRCPECWGLRKKALSERVHRCQCGCEQHRDIAAAQVVLRWAIAQQLGQELPQTAHAVKPPPSYCIGGR